jgi:hypothetical protein
MAGNTHTVSYTPPPTVEHFIRDYIPGELFYNFIIGPYGSGKTTGNFFKIIHMAMLQAPSPLDGKRKTKVVVVRNTSPQLLDTTIPSWNLWFKDGQAGRWIAGIKTFQLRFGDVECDIMFRPLDTPDDVARVLSLEVTFAVLDEFVEIPQEIVDALSGRCGRYPQANEWPEDLPPEQRGATNYGMWGASNPGNEDSWWYKHLVENCPTNVKYFHQPSGLSAEAENLGGLKGGVKYYQNLAVGKPDSWVKQFIDAEWGFSVSGRPVVPTFNRALHVSTRALSPDPYLPLVIGYDPGVRHSALVFGQFDFYGRLHVLDELVLEGYGTRRMIEDRLLPMLKWHYPQQEVVIAPDPAANSRTPTDETSSMMILKDKKYKERWSVKVGETNLLTPRLEAIEYYTTRITEKGPALVIDPKCKTLSRALASGWKYVINKNGNDRPEPDKNVWSHPGDAFGYLCQYGHKGEVRRGKRTNANQQKVLPKFTNTYNIR